MGFGLLENGKGMVMAIAKELRENKLCLEESKDQAQDLLDKVRAILKRRLSFFVWQGFFEPLSAISVDQESLILSAPTSFHRNWVTDHYMSELSSAIAESCGEVLKVEIKCSNENTNKSAGQRIKEKKKNAAQQALLLEDSEKTSIEKKENENPKEIISPKPIQEATIIPILPHTNLNNVYSFESYIPGPSNQMGYAAAMSVAEHPATQFSPLFLFGGVGLGKTHLLHAIGLRAKQNNPTLKVVYLSAEQWVNSYIQAIRERQFDSFRNRFRNSCDILLIDDVQFLAGKDASQDEFFHTFNCLHEAKKQIVLSSDKYPHEINGLEERLRTRLSWGLIADIRPPEMETRVAILHKKSEKMAINLSEEVIQFLATNVTNSVRELEGALLRLASYSSLCKQEISLGQAREILAPILKPKSPELSWQKLCALVAAHFKVNPDDLQGSSRQRQISLARQVSMALCRTRLNMSLLEIGRAFGNRDHSTVVCSIKRIDQLREKDLDLANTFSKLEAKISC